MSVPEGPALVLDHRVSFTLTTFLVNGEYPPLVQGDRETLGIRWQKNRPDRRSKSLSRKQKVLRGRSNRAKAVPDKQEEEEEEEA